MMPLRTIEFRTPSRMLSSNERVHFMSKARITKSWRDAACYAAIAATPGQRARALPPCRVRVSLPVPDRRRRDPSNYVGTVVKALVDGLVDAGLWQDDTPDFVEIVQPLLIVGAQCVTVDLFPLEP